MRRLLSDKKYRSSFILNVAGIIFAIVGGLLNELNSPVDGSNLILVGIILWGVGEGNLVRALLKERDG